MRLSLQDTGGGLFRPEWYEIFDDDNDEPIGWVAEFKDGSGSSGWQAVVNREDPQIKGIAIAETRDEALIEAGYIDDAYLNQDDQELYVW